MNKLDLDELYKYVEVHIGEFHSARLESLAKLKLKDILLRKNPYLFKAKNILTAESLVKILLDAHLSSQEETIFGEFLEGLAIYINSRVYGGTKSAAEGIDLEFQVDEIKYIVTIKSGPNWGNSSQIARMKDNFSKAKRILKTNSSVLNVVAVNGCCYGRDNSPDKGEYLKLCGQNFWAFISDDKNLYTKIIEPLSHKTEEKNQEFLESYAQIINKFTTELSKDFFVDNKINWQKLIEFNSSADSNKKNTEEAEADTQKI